MKLTREDIAPDLRGSFKAVPRFVLQTGIVRTLASALLKKVPVPKAEGVTISVPGKGAPGMRLYMPDTRKGNGALLWIHGGGYIIGAASIDDQLCAQASRELGIPVISAEYRLAPKHAYPAALDDCHAVWHWILDHADDLGVDRGKIAIGGVSAGGGLAAALVQRLHDEGGQRVAAQWLLTPMLDDRTAARRELDGIGHFLWDNSLNALGWKSYLGREPGAAGIPAYAAPARRENLEGLPSAWIGVGSIELFFEEDNSYADRLKTAGCDVTLDILDRAPHGFETWGGKTETVQAYLRKGWAWLAEKLA